MKRYYFRLGVIFTVWLFLAVLSFDVAFLTKALVQFFATGMSAFKDYFFLFWAALCFYALATGKVPVYRKSQGILMGLIGALGALNFLSYFILVKRYDLKFSDRVLAVSNRSCSSNVFNHTHTLKPMLMPLVEALGLRELLQKTDPGQPYYVLLPHALYFLGLPLVFITGFFFIRILQQKAPEWEAAKRWSFIFVYIISSFAILKSFFDGGPFSSEFIMYTPVFFLITASSNESFSTLAKKYFWCVQPALFIGIMIYVLIKPENIAVLFHQIGIFSFFPVFVFLLIYILANRRWLFIPLLLGTGGILAWMGSDFFWANTLKLLRTHITQDDRVYLVNFNGENYPYPVYARDGQLVVHVFHPDKGAQIWDLFKERNIPSTYGRANVAGRTCGEGAGYGTSGRLIAVDGMPVMQDSNPPEIFDAFEVKPCESGKTDCWRYKAQVRGCIPNGSEELIYNHLDKMGFKVFIMIPDRPFI